MTPRAWMLWLAQALIGWFVTAHRLLYPLHPGATIMISVAMLFLVLAIALSYLIVRERVVLWALLWNAGFRGALAKAARNATQDEADFNYSQAQEAMIKAQALRIEELTGTVETQATMIRNANAKIAALEEQVGGLRRANGRRKEDRA